VSAPNDKDREGSEGAPLGAAAAAPGRGGERLYALDSKSAGSAVFEGLGERFETRAEVDATTRTYYDTFDRRLAGAGSILCLLRGGSERALLWERLSGVLVRRLVTGTAPTFAGDLPAGAFRAALEPMIGVRKLLPVAKASGRARRLCILDREGKTTARVRAESWAPAKPGAGAAQKVHLLRVSPVRGYAGAEKKIRKLLEGRLGLRPLPPSAFAEILGLAEGVDSAKGAWPPPLEAGMRSDAAVRLIYRGLLETMQANEDGMRRRTDPEFLHEYRVALRRTRAGLARLRDLFPQATVDRFRREFAWLGQVTGPVRDADVQLMEVPAYAASLPDEVRDHLLPLRTWLEQQGTSAQKALVRALDTARYARLMKAWAAFVEAPAPRRTSLSDAPRPIEDVARERIWKLHRRILRRGRRIDADTPAADVHDLRLTAKKLRYLMEFFRLLFPGKPIKRQIAALRSLQEVLGRFNDFEVQQGALRTAAAAMTDSGDVPLDSLLVLGRLVETLQGRQDEARAKVTGRVAAFTTRENLVRARKLFGPRKQEPGA
jgi:CHAD domain-containing protein